MTCRKALTDTDTDLDDTPTSIVYLGGNKLVQDKLLTKAKLEAMEAGFTAEWRHDPKYSGEHHDHGMNIQVVCGPSAKLDRVSQAQPGPMHDTKAARAVGLSAALAAHPDPDVPVVADLGYKAIDGWATPYRKPPNGALTDEQRDYDKAQSGLRIGLERAIGHFKGHWRILRDNNGDQRQTGDVARACLVLSRFLRDYDQPPLRHARLLR